MKLIAPAPLPQEKKRYKHIYNSDLSWIGITSGRVRDGEVLYTKILEVTLFAFAYRLSHEDFSQSPAD